MDIEFEVADAMEVVCDNLLEQGDIKRIETDDDKIRIVLSVDNKEVTIFRFIATDKVALAVGD